MPFLKMGARTVLLPFFASGGGRSGKGAMRRSRPVERLRHDRCGSCRNRSGQGDGRFGKGRKSAAARDRQGVAAKAGGSSAQYAFNGNWIRRFPTETRPPRAVAGRPRGDIRALPDGGVSFRGCYPSTGFTEPTKGCGPEKVGAQGIWHTWAFSVSPSQWWRR